MNVLSPTNLKEHEYTDTSWYDNEIFNIERLNTLFSSLDNFGEVLVTSPRDGDLLFWSEANSRLENAPEFTTTTSTSTTTTTSSSTTTTTTA